MHFRKRTLWYVPLYCVVAGALSYLLFVYVLYPIWVKKLPDGSVSSDHIAVLVVSCALFLAALLLGGLVFFRGMTRWELFFSASLVVLYGELLLFIQWALHLTTGPHAVCMLYLFRPSEWFSFVSQLLITLHCDSWLGSAVAHLTPYLFILFGKPRPFQKRPLGPS